MLQPSAVVMRRIVRAALISLSGLVLWGGPSVQAWQMANRSSATTSTTWTASPGIEAITVSVGCGSTVTYPTDEALDPTRPRFTYVIESAVAEFISLHFKKFNLPPEDCVVIRPTTTGDGEKKSLQYCGKSHRNRFFTRALHTKSVTLELFTNGTGEAVNAQRCRGFVIDQYRYLAAPAQFSESSTEALCGPDDSDEATCFQSYPTAFERSRAVARLLIHKNKKSYFCTGWLVGTQGHVMTNHHCISEPLHAENTEFEFLAEGTACSTKCGKPFGCRGKTRATTATLVVANKALDYALVQVDPALVADYGFLQMREGGATMNERLYIPQHPAGWGKRIAMKDGHAWGKVTSLTRGGCIPNQVAYSLDTQGGSSGSPVLSWNDNSVVALHHCGGCPNTAVNTKHIVADLRAKGLLPERAVYDGPSDDDVDDENDD